MVVSGKASQTQSLPTSGPEDASFARRMPLLGQRERLRCRSPSVLPPWHENLSKRQVKAPKVYLRDSGLLHALLEIATARHLNGHPKVGASWEGFAIESIIARYVKYRRQGNWTLGRAASEIRAAARRCNRCSLSCANDLAGNVGEVLYPSTWAATLWPGRLAEAYCLRVHAPPATPAQDQALKQRLPFPGRALSMQCCHPCRVLVESFQILGVPVPS